MASSLLKPQFHVVATLTPRSSSKPKSYARFDLPLLRAPVTRTFAGFSDPFVLELAESIEDSLPSSPLLQNLRDNSSQSLLYTPWPSLKDELFRFTDTSFIKQAHIRPVSQSPCLEHLANTSTATHLPNLLVVNGFVLNSISCLSNMPNAVYVGSLLNECPDKILKRVSNYLGDFQCGDIFWSLNGMGAPDVAVIYVPSGVKVEDPIYLRYVSVNGSEDNSNELPVCNPRVFMAVEDGGEIGIIEEFVGNGGGDHKRYWSNSVLEVVVGKGAKVKHSYVQSQSLNSAHTKWTSVRQKSRSSYELVEASTGGKLSRHNLHVQQLGQETMTEVSTFHLSYANQTQDLHSKLIFDYPRAYARQLHKSIVSHSLGQSVFDGNIKINRYAQQTDAGQLTRTLLLEPRATVSSKPNLQIVADDVKCSHGAAISDLEESKIFYFQARGMDPLTARKALMFSFSSEVVDRLPYPFLRAHVAAHVSNQLQQALPD